MKRLTLPLGLILFRFLLAPLMLFLTESYGLSANRILVVVIYLGLISDILDGIVARHQGIQTATLRRMDSQTDLDQAVLSSVAI